jgi:5-methylcytosine-specific restriction endonuclease McrA
MVGSMTQRRVLLVDAGLQPINIISLKRAFVLLFSKRTQKVKQPQILKYSTDGAVVGCETKVRVPSVIQLGYMIPRYKQRIRFCRKNVLIGRDRGICQYCSKQFPTDNGLTFDHVVPRTQGGKTVWENVVACCFDCNQKKAGRTPEQASMRLMRKPTRPTQLVDVSVKVDLHEWGDYWNVTLLP